MDAIIRTFDKNSRDYESLNNFAKLLNQSSGQIRYAVEDTYYDYGQNWRWTTIIAHRPATIFKQRKTESWQVLSPHDQRIVLTGKDEDKENLFQRLTSDSKHT